MIHTILLLVLIVAGANNCFEDSLIGQFAVTSNDSIVYLDNLGGWHYVDMYVGRSRFFVITTPLVRYDTSQARYNQSFIVSDTSREIERELSVMTAFEIIPMQIKRIENVSIGTVVLNVPKCPKLVLQSGVEAVASIILLIDTLGSVTDAMILETNGVNFWNEIALNTIKTGQFNPIKINGKPEEAWLIIPTGNHIERLPE